MLKPYARDLIEERSTSPKIFSLRLLNRRGCQGEPAVDGPPGIAPRAARPCNRHETRAAARRSRCLLSAPLELWFRRRTAALERPQA